MKNLIPLIVTLFQVVFIGQITAGCCADYCQSEQSTEVDCEKKQKKDRLKRGGILYDRYGTAIHARRYSREFTRAQWKTIMLQKRVRIPLSAEEHRSLSKLLVDE